MWKGHLKHSTTEFKSIQHFWHNFREEKKKKNKNKKNADARVWGDACGDQKPETFYWPDSAIGAFVESLV